jgi:hypothetical protein
MKTENDLETRPEAQLTVGDGDCAFHAAFGKPTPRGYFCSNVEQMRQRLAQAVRDAEPTSPLYGLVVEEMQLLIESHLPVSGRLHELRHRYQQFQLEKQRALDATWDALEALIDHDQHFDFVFFVSQQSPVGSFKQKFDKAMSEQRETLEKHIAGSAIAERYGQYRNHIQSGFDWKSLDDGAIIQDYAEQRLTPLHRHLSNHEIHMMALVFGMTITLSYANGEPDQTYNPEQQAAVTIQHNDHYERVVNVPLVTRPAQPVLTVPISKRNFSVGNCDFRFSKQAFNTLRFTCEQLKCVPVVRGCVQLYLETMEKQQTQPEDIASLAFINELKNILAVFDAPLPQNFAPDPTTQLFFMAAINYHASTNAKIGYQYKQKAWDYLQAAINSRLANAEAPEDWEPEFISNFRLSTLHQPLEEQAHLYFFHQPVLADLYQLRSHVKQLHSDQTFVIDRALADYHRGLIYSFYGIHGGAIDYFSRALPQVTKAVQQRIFLERGHSHWCSGEWQLATDDYHAGRALGLLNAKHMNLLYRAAQTDFVLGEFVRAESVAETFISLLPTVETADPLKQLVADLGQLSLSALETMSHHFKIRLLLTHLAYHQRGIDKWLHHAGAALAIKGISEAEWYKESDAIYEQANALIAQALHNRNPQQILGLIRIVEKCHKKIFALQIHGLYRPNHSSQSATLCEPTLSPRYHLRLLSFYTSLHLSPEIGKLIDLEKIRGKTKQLLRSMKAPTHPFEGNLKPLLALFKQLLTHQKYPEETDAGNYYEWLTSKKREHLQEAQCSPQEGIIHLLQSWASCGFIATYAYAQQVQVLQISSLTQNHDAYLRYLQTQLEELRLIQTLLSLSNKPENPKENIAKIDTAYYACLRSLDTYQNHLDQQGEPQAVQRYKSISLKSLYYALYRLRILIVKEQLNHYQKTESHAEALKACNELVTLTQTCIEISANSSRGSWVFAALQPTLQQGLVDLTRFLIDIKTLESQFKTQNLQDELQACEKKRKRLEEQVANEPLTVFYGKKHLVMPFFYQPQSKTMQVQRAREPIRDDCCLGVVSISILYRSGNETFTGNLPLTHPVSPHALTLTELASQESGWTSQTDAILERLQKGKAIALQMRAAHPAIPLQFLDTPAVQDLTTFVPKPHLHAEQALYTLLNQQNIADFVSRFQKANPKFQPGVKVKAVSLDFEIELTMCACCKLAVLAMQSEDLPTYFLPKLKTYLKTNGYILPKIKDAQPQLTCISRTHGDSLFDNKVIHQNPRRENIKLLQNIGLFETYPSVNTASGSRGKLYKQ